jgi:hypothetical protein
MAVEEIIINAMINADLEVISKLNRDQELKLAKSCSEYWGQ